MTYVLIREHLTGTAMKGGLDRSDSWRGYENMLSRRG